MKHSDVTQNPCRRLSFCSLTLLFLLLLSDRNASAGIQNPALSPFPALLVLNKADSTLAIVNPLTFKVVGRVPTGVGAHEVTVSADGKTAYLTNYGDQQTAGNTLSVVDIAACKETGRVNLGGLKRPHGITEKNGAIYFASDAGKCIARYNPRTGQVDWKAKTGRKHTSMLVISRDGRCLYTANAPESSVSFIELIAGRVTTVKVRYTPENLDISPDGKELWVGHNTSGKVTILDTASGRVREILTVCKAPFRMRFTPDGRRVLVSDTKQGRLYIYDAGTRREIKQIPVGGAIAGIQATPDSRCVFVASRMESSVSVIDLNTFKITNRFRTGNMPDGMAWASDQAKRIVPSPRLRMRYLPMRERRIAS